MLSELPGEAVGFTRLYACITAPMMRPLASAGIEWKAQDALSNPNAMKFCSDCGAPVTRRIPQGDLLPRYVCESCGVIHYQNPKLVIGAIAEWEDKILLCKRAIEPRAGYWTLPAGFMENGETTAQAAARETLEEANARIEVGELFSLINVPHINQVHLVYRAHLIDLAFGAGLETLETRLLEESSIPWDEIAFRSIAMALRLYYSDRKNGAYRFHAGDILIPR